MVQITVRTGGLLRRYLPEGSKHDMDFKKASEAGSKAWKDIWGAGQGVGNIADVSPARDVVLRMEKEYRDALARVGS